MAFLTELYDNKVVFTHAGHQFVGFGNFISCVRDFDYRCKCCGLETTRTYVSRVTACPGQLACPSCAALKPEVSDYCKDEFHKRNK